MEPPLGDGDNVLIPKVVIANSTAKFVVDLFWTTHTRSYSAYFQYDLDRSLYEVNEGRKVSGADLVEICSTIVQDKRLSVPVPSFSQSSIYYVVHPPPSPSLAPSRLSTSARARLPPSPPSPSSLSFQVNRLDGAGSLSLQVNRTGALSGGCGGQSLRRSAPSSL